MNKTKMIDMINEKIQDLIGEIKTLEDKVKLLERENEELKEETRENERDPDSRTWGR